MNTPHSIHSKKFLYVALAFFSLTAFSQTGSDPKAYAQRFAIEPASAQAGLQRLHLPAETLIALRTAGYADLRIFNSQGQAVPMALVPSAAEQKLTQQSVSLPLYPIYGGGDSGAASPESISLRIETGAQTRVIELNEQGKPVAASSKQVTGILLDVRSITASAVNLQLSAETPAGQSVQFDLQVSQDLKTWRSIGSAAAFSSGTELKGGLHIPAKFDLQGVALKDQYLRIAWDRKITPVQIQSAQLSTETRQSALARVSANLPVSMSNPHEFSFELPFATPVPAMDVKLQGSNSLIPVEVFTRSDKSQAWQAIAKSVLYQLNIDGKTQNSSLIELGRSVSSTGREIKVQADKKTLGFVQAPQVQLAFDSMQIVFVASGSPPFQLAAGLANASSGFLPINSLIPSYQYGDENKLPLSKIIASGLVNAVSAHAAIVITADSSKDPLFNKERILWGVLILGVLLMGAMAWSLMRKMKTSENETK